MVGFGRKGSACKPMEAGESLVMAHGNGAGIVRRLWVTIPDRIPELMLGMVIRMRPLRNAVWVV